MTKSSFIQVAVPVPLVGELDYQWTKPEPPPSLGCRVRVPLGKREKIGIVVRHIHKSTLDTGRIKGILEALDTEPVLNTELFRLLCWCARYYHHPIGEVLTHALPILLRQGRAAKGSEKFWKLTKAGAALTSKQCLGKLQAQVIDLLQHSVQISSRTLLDVGINGGVLQRMVVRGWVQCIEKTPLAKPNTRPTDSPQKLTVEQQTCVSTITDATEGYAAYLLQGVTGSGKTEVYMHLISNQLRVGRQSLLLVPEISLTPQLLKRLENRFGSCLAVMHSGLTAVERLEAWRKTRSGEAKIILGTRSAIFAPLVNAGLIIVDEEHDSSYKQQDGFKYSARDLSVLRARGLRIPVLLASATPSLESIHNVKRGRYQGLRMDRPIGSAGKPKIQVIDMNVHAARHGLSTPLITAIERHLSLNQQVLLFLNRRGFAPVLLCTECGTVEECDRCDARMTLHARIGQLRCHHCARTRPLTWGCGICATERIAVGTGTQRVTDELQALFPEIKIARLDRDVTSNKGSLETVLADVEHGKTQIVVGTQMLTKGHDFPKVTLVGVLSADQGLFGTDFRCSEKLAQMLLQVAGRAGRRDQPGEVFIQSHYPAHPLLATLAEQNYDAFVDLALAEREATAWPPFSHLIVWRAEATNKKTAQKFLECVASAARTMTDGITILGPAAPSMEKRGNRFRTQLLFQHSSRKTLHDLTRNMLQLVLDWPQARRIRWSIDVDPAEL
tara:strand:- start:889 stop:3072 length:2184 start_codon:yes stop_codon:yes gene_type:complete